MRQKALFIYGAGASKADHAPLQNELFSEIFDLLEGVNSYSDIDLNPDFIKEMKNFLYKLYPINRNIVKNVDYPTFEEVMGLIYFAIIRDESFKGISYYNLSSYLEKFTALIAYILYEKLKIIPNINRRFLDCLFTTFQKKYINDAERSDSAKIFIKKFSFLNINYDILLDNAVFDLRNNHGIEYDYCFEIKKKFDKLKLFKPHGSLNWLLCKACGKIQTDEYNKISISYYESILKKLTNRKKCECGTEYSPLIIPPSFFKELNNTVIRNILINLENHLRKVENLVFIGYSFPEADLHLKYIFKRAQLFGGFKKIILINKEGGDDLYYRNVKRSFPGVNIIDLTPVIPNGLEKKSIEPIVERLFEYL
jgi:hypothetical protein